MLLILDTNEYVFALGTVRQPACEKLLEEIAKNLEDFCVRIPRLIVNEVRSNLTLQAFKEFMLLIHKLAQIDDDSEIPFELGAKYETMEFKPADALIAAYVEWTGAEMLVSENRHFLTRQSNLPFKVVNAETCIKVIRLPIR